MRWISRLVSGHRFSDATNTHQCLAALAAAATTFLFALILSAAPEKRLTIYSVAANYSLPLVQRDGRDYVGMREVLERLGKEGAKGEGSRWRRFYNSAVEGDFQTGKNRARIQGRDSDLLGKFRLENGRGLVPVAALGSLLPRLLGGPVTLHEDSERLFIGSIATHFTATLASDNPPRLVFNFTAPVNPSIATEPGTLRMTFARDPVVSPAAPTLTFGSKTIPSAVYSESNGAATVTVNSATAIMATFSNGNRTLTISPASAQKPEPAVANIPAGSTPPSLSPTRSTITAAPAVFRRYFAIVDASHGGDDHGATLSTTLLDN